MNRILVIDDDIDILNVVDMMLTMNGYSVETLDKWSLTYEKIDAFNPHLILLDISLGGEDGRNISRQIKLNHSTKDIHIILFSAIHNWDKNLSDSLANDFIGKPFEVKELLQKINSQLQN